MIIGVVLRLDSGLWRNTYACDVEVVRLNGN